MRCCCQYTTSCFKEEMGVSLRRTFGLFRSPYYTVAMATMGRCQTLKTVDIYTLKTTERSEDKDIK